MKFTRSLALIVGMALLITACNRESADTSAAIQENTNPLLAYVPADTAYVFAALEPLPEDISDAYVERFQPILDIMSARVEQFKAGYQSGDYHENDMARLVTAVLNELGGSLNADSLEKVGISTQSHQAVYAMGMFPVVRLELNDAQALRDAIGRIEAEMGYKMPVREFNGASFWQVTHAGHPMGVYISIDEQQLAFSVFPVSAEAHLLPSFLGQEMPANSLASSNALAIMNSEKGYTAYGSGFMDIQKLTNELLNSNSDTHTYLGADMGFDPSSLEPVCITELNSIISKAPRMTAGTTQLTANEFAMRYELELESTLTGSLAALVSNVPSAEQGNHLFSASVAMNVGKLRNFVLEKATALVSSPYQCEMLQQLNHDAGDLVKQLNIPMPPMVNNLMGARVRLDDIHPGMDPAQVSGLFALHVEKPEMFVGMANMMVPGFDSLDLTNEGEPVKIPVAMIQVDGIEVFAMMNDDSIGVSLGQDKAQELNAFMDAAPQENGTFMSISYDTAKQMEIAQAIAKAQGVDDYPPVEDEFSEGIQKTYADMLGHSHIAMRFTGTGLVIDSNITFK